MASISEQFESLRTNNQCALIPFVTAGEPSLDITAEALRVLDASGADFIELGIPYSDPQVDRPVIQVGATRALKQETRLIHVLEMAHTVIRSLRSPIILCTYYNQILNFGIQQFLEQAATSGIKGLVIPDLPLKEANEVLGLADAVDIEVTLLVTPTSSKERIEAIASQSHGFIYLVNVTDVTGVRSQINTHIKDVIRGIRSVTNKPIGLGFGISEPEHARQARDCGADAVIVRSAFVQSLAEGTPYRGLRAIKDFCNDLKTSITPVLR
ncbi:MAG: tryptophan synthase subunit alpha [Gloeotrichia echinulata GP01]